MKAFTKTLNRILPALLITLFVLSITFFSLVIWPFQVWPADATLQWDPAENADGYRIYFGTDIDNLNHSINTGTLTTWTVPDLKCGTEYHFQVKAYNEQGESDPTNTVTATTPGCPQLPIIPEGWKVDSLVLVPAAP